MDKPKKEENDKEEESQQKDIKKQEDDNQQKVVTKEKENDNEDNEEKKEVLETEEIFTKFMQSFHNRSKWQLKLDTKFQQLIKERKFWKNQPVPKPQNLTSLSHGALEKKKTKEIQKENIKLPENFVWDDFDLQNDENIDEIYHLLYENYVEDDDGCFRFDYSREFLRWALLPPGYHKDLYFGIRDQSKNGTLVGFISGIVLNLTIEQKSVKATEVNFLCVKKTYRNHYIAAVLIREVVRRSNVKGIWQGLYTSGTMLPTPVGQARYYHRSLNPKKLIQTNFSYLPKNQTIKLREKIYSLPSKIDLPEGCVIRPTEIKDIKQVKNLLSTFLGKFDLFTNYSKKECQHWFVHRKDILESYVIEKNGKISEFFSFYNLPSTILNSKKYKTIKAAYSYYFVNTKLSLKDLYQIALIKAKECGYDVFNTLDILDNQKIFEDLLFSGGDGYLQYYLYNWKLKKNILFPKEIGVVLM